MLRSVAQYFPRCACRMPSMALRARDKRAVSSSGWDESNVSRSEGSFASKCTPVLSRQSPLGTSLRMRPGSKFRAGFPVSKLSKRRAFSLWDAVSVSFAPTSGQRTRHINIRYYFITDRIAKNEVTVQYCPTGEMIADYFSKPLQGQQL